MAPFVHEVSFNLTVGWVVLTYRQCQVEVISIFIDGMDEDVKEVDKIHSHILSSPKPDESKKKHVIYTDNPFIDSHSWVNYSFFHSITFSLTLNMNRQEKYW